MDGRGVWSLNGIGPDKEFHDHFGNHYLLMGQRLMKNGAVVGSTRGCPTVQNCRLEGDRLIVEYAFGRVEYQGVYPGPPGVPGPR